MALNRHHPLHPMLVYDVNWNETFSTLWQLSHESKTCKTDAAMKDFEENTYLPEVCDKFESIILSGIPVHAMDDEVGVYNISLRSAAQYLKGIVMLHNIKVGKAMDAAFSLMDASKWKPFFAIDTKPLPAYRVNVPKKSTTNNMNAADWFDDDIDYASTDDLSRQLVLQFSTSLDMSLGTLFNLESEEAIQKHIQKNTMPYQHGIVEHAPDQEQIPPVGLDEGTLSDRPDDLGGPVNLPEIGSQPRDEREPAIVSNKTTTVEPSRAVSQDVLRDEGAQSTSNSVVREVKKGRRKLFGDRKLTPGTYTEEDYDEMIHDYLNNHGRMEPSSLRDVPLVWSMTRLEYADKDYKFFTPVQETIKKAVESKGDAEVEVTMPILDMNEPPDALTKESSVTRDPNLRNSEPRGADDQDIGDPALEPMNFNSLPVGQFSQSRHKEMRLPKVNKQRSHKVKSDFLTEEQRKTYRMDPSNADSVLTYLKLIFRSRSSIGLYNLAPPGIWHPEHVTMLIQQLLDFATRGYVTLKQNGPQFDILLVN